MGQHKHNPTAIAAKEGKLPPKPQKLSKAEYERELREALWGALFEKEPQAAAVAAVLSGKYRKYV